MGPGVPETREVTVPQQPRVRVDDEGIHLSGHLDDALDVRFGPDRVWSFTTRGEGSHALRGVLVRWPARLRPLLDGVAEVSVVRHGTEDALFSDTVQLGASAEPLVLRDDAGNPLSIDKTGRLQRSFERMGDDSRRELVEAARRLTDTLVDRLGVATYLSYGCLLGAARTGHMIGHDSDIDLAFLSRYDHPFDIIRESRAAERGIRELGWRVVRLSAANFKVWVPLPNGKRAGVDVFGSFYVSDVFHLTGNLRGPLPREALVPFGTIELEGVPFPAPADVERFLTFTYGPGWRIPDPAFHFDHPQATKDRMNQWLRTGRHGIVHWEAFYTQGRADRVPTGPSPFAEWVDERIDPGSRIVELGSGTGRDAIWFARQGHEVIGSDYCLAARRYAGDKARAAGVDVPFREFNAAVVRSMLVRGSRMARLPGVKHVYARLLVDEVHPSARPGFWRFCSMVGRTGGRTYVEFRTDANRVRFVQRPAWPSPDAVTAEIERAGGRIRERVIGRGLANEGGRNPVVCRMEVEWR
jgi:SAM-dependent methyltransferase